MFSFYKHVLPTFFMTSVLLTTSVSGSFSQSLTIIDRNGVPVAVWGDRKSDILPPLNIDPPQVSSERPNAVFPDVEPLLVVPAETILPSVVEKEQESVNISDEGGCAQKFSSRKQGQFLSIVQGDYISKQLNDWARFHGYNLAWEADEYMALGTVKFDGSFEEMLEKFRESMAESGIGLDVSVYKNCVVRITSRK
jgi:hypothetical protein